MRVIITDLLIGVCELAGEIRHRSCPRPTGQFYRRIQLNRRSQRHSSGIAEAAAPEEETGSGRSP